MQACTDEGCPVGMTCQVADFTKSLKSVSKFVMRGTSLRSLLKSTIKNMWTGASKHLGRELGVCALNTWVKFGRQCDLTSVSRMLEQVFDDRGGPGI